MPTASGRISRERVIAQLKLAAKKGDRTALQLALGEMRTLAYSPKYWSRYLLLLSHPLARLVDLLVIKQGERIGKQKGWVKLRQTDRGSSRQPRARAGKAQKPAKRRRTSVSAALQPSLFPELDHEAVSSSSPRRKKRSRAGA